MKPAEQEALFRDWAERHRGILLHVARGFAADADRDDLLQDMLLAVWHAVPRFRGAAAPATFVYRVAQNTALDWLRRRQRRPAEDSLEEQDHAAPDADPAPAAGTERSEALYRAIRRLPETDRTLILLYLDEMSYRDMAAVLGLSESNIGVRLHRIRARLAALIHSRPQGEPA